MNARGAALHVRHAASMLPVPLGRISRRASVSCHADRAKPARSTRDSPVLAHGAVTQATGRAYIAWRTLAERLSTSDMQPSSCTAISGVSRAEHPSAVTLTVMSVRAPRALSMPPRPRTMLEALGRV